MVVTIQIHSQGGCNSSISLNNIPDQNICDGESVTLTASASIMPEDNMVITAAFDGPLSGGTPKGIELYVINEIADLSQYGIGSANNGGGSDGEEFTFPSSSATAGQYIYVASDSAQFNNWFGFDADYVSGSANINGDDAMELFYNGLVIDVFGDINVDGTGQPWDYMDGWAYRNSSTGPDGSTFVLNSWSFSGTNALDGESLNSTAVSPIPVGTFVHNGSSTINGYTIDVTTSSSMDFTFNGDFAGSDPSINLNLGDTLIFNVNTPGHPFWINTVQGTGSSNGVAITNNGTSSGTITWVPTASGTYYYNCEFHSMMTGTITVGSPAISYVWDNGVTNGVPFTPTTSGDYIVVATDTSGCSATDTVSVSINALPTVDAGSDQTICFGDQVTLNGAGASSFLWDNGVSDGIAFSPLSTATYTVSGTDANGCINTDQVVVTVNALPAINAGSDVSVCIGDSLFLNGSGGLSYIWDNGVTDGVLFIPTTTTTYNVTGTDANGCINSDQVVVTVNALPTVSAGTDQTICSGDQVTLNGAGASSFLWDNGATDGVSFSLTTTSTYIVTGTDVNGCVNIDQVTLTVNTLPTVDAGADQTICSGDQVTLNGAGASSFLWDNGATDGVSFSLTTTTTYTVTGTDTNGCVNTDQVTVTVNTLPTVDAGADQTICIGDTVTLNGSGASSFTWNNGVTDGVSFSPLSTATYTVIGTDGNGCINSDQLVVTVNAMPAINAGSDVAVCIGDSLFLNGSGGMSYNWNNGVTDGVYFAPLFSNTYTVTGTDINGCINTDTVAVTVNPLPSVSTGADQTVCENDTITVSGSGASTYVWDNGVTDNVPFTITNTTSFIVTGTDVNGCSNTDSLIITTMALPVLVAIATEDTTCINNNTGVGLSGTPVGGTFSGTGVSGTTFYPQNSGLGSFDIVYSYTDTNGCVGADTITIVVSECSSLLENLNITINLYPNPTDGDFTIDFSELIIGKIEITNNIGQIVQNVKITDKKMSFNLSKQQSRGIYFVKIYSDKNELLKIEKVLFQ